MTEVTYESVRGWVFEALRSAKKPREQPVTQVERLVNRVLELAQPDGDLPSASRYQIAELTREVFWDLVIQRVLTIGMNAQNSEYPWFRTTEYGDRVLTQINPTPHDPTGYLKAIEDAGGLRNDDATDFLSEALDAFRVGCIRASFVMLGCSAECLLLTLGESIVAHARDATQKSRIPEGLGCELDGVQEACSHHQAHQRATPTANFSASESADRTDQARFLRGIRADRLP